MNAPLDARVDLGRWLVAQRDALAGFVRKRAGRLLLRLETAEDLAQGICAHLLERGARPHDGEEAAQRAWLYTASERWLSDRRDHWSALKPARPDSSAVGTPGSSVERFAVVSASGRILPPWTWGRVVGIGLMATCTCPAATSAIAGAQPL